MKLIDLIERAKQSERAIKGQYVFLDPLLEDLGLDSWRLPPMEEIDHDFVEIPVLEWVCTDTYVGHTLYLKGDIPIAMKSKFHRKDHTYIYWITGHGVDTRKVVTNWFYENKKDSEMVFDSIYINAEISIDDLITSKPEHFVTNLFDENFKK